MTPLHWAVQKGHNNIAKLLLRHGADPNAMSKFSKTPIILAAELEQNDLVQDLLIQNSQRSDFEQQQAADTLVHELSARMKVRKLKGKFCRLDVIFGFFVFFRMMRIRRIRIRM